MKIIDYSVIFLFEIIYFCKKSDCMSNTFDSITHTGFIQSIDKDKINVMILSQSACSGCHAKSMCAVADMKEKVIEISKKSSDNYKIGDKVTVVMERSMGPKAVFYGYFFPFLVVLISLIVLISLTENEGLAGLISLVLLIPYYFMIYLLRDKLKKKFEFKIN